MTYSWDFDFTDGIQDDQLGHLVNHSYNVGGRYKVTLTVSDGLVKKSTFIFINITTSDTPGTDDPTKESSRRDTVELDTGLLLLVIIIIAVIILALGLFAFTRSKKQTKRSKMNKYLDDIDAAYDWARTNTSVGKEKLSNLKLNLSRELKDGKLEPQEYSILENKLNEYMRLLGMTIASSGSNGRVEPGKIALAAPLPPTGAAQLPSHQPALTPKVTTVTPVQPTPSLPAKTGQKDIIKCYNCGHVVTITRAPPGEPTLIHCPNCGQDGKI